MLNAPYLGLALAAVIAAAYFLVPKLWALALPPHEFAYGTPLATLEELPAAVAQFLNLEALDPAKTKIEVSMLDRASGTGKDIKTLADYFRGTVASRPGGASLVSDLERANSLPDVQRQIEALLSTLIRNRELIRDEANQDKIVVFIHYRLKELSALSADAQSSISSMVNALDTEKQALSFESNQAPSNYLAGNVNIYPLAIENRGWYESLNLPGDRTRPILEIRFMGLRGIFRYLLDSMEDKSRLSFTHLDGEEVCPTSK